jgi:hypothetical protein
VLRAAFAVDLALLGDCEIEPGQVAGAGDLLRLCLEPIDVTHAVAATDRTVMPVAIDDPYPAAGGNAPPIR